MNEGSQLSDQLIALFVFVLLECSAMWATTTTFKVWGRVKHEINEFRVHASVYLAIILGTITTIGVPICFGKFVCNFHKGRDYIKSWLSWLIFLSFCLVFSAVFMNTSYVYMVDESFFKTNIPANLAKELVINYVFVQSVGFLGAGGFAFLYCCH